MHENNITRNLYNRYNEILSVESSTIIQETPKKRKGNVCNIHIFY